MDRTEFPFGAEFAELETWPDHGLNASGPVAVEDGVASYVSEPRRVQSTEDECQFESLSKGTFLNETIRLRDPEDMLFVTAVIDLFGPHRSLQRKRHTAEVENERLLVSCMLANGLRCAWYRDPPIVAYQRKADAKPYTKPNKPDWLSAQALGRATILFQQAGLVRLQRGERKTASGYVVTRKLLALAQKHCVSELRRFLHREDLVQLKSMKPPASFNRWTRTVVRQKADRIYFAPTPQTEEWRDTLTAYNDFVARQDIRVEPSSELAARWVADLNDDETHSGTRLVRPELFRSAIYRVFNDGTTDKAKFDRGGRLVGGWWINAPKEVRSLITINGEPTVELDYSACHPRMLYHERGLEPPADPYDIPTIAKLERQAGLEAGHYRPTVKWLMQVLINGKGRPDLVSVPTDIPLPTDVGLLDLSAIIAQCHEPIASAFRTRAGLRLMKIESDIALAIIAKAMKTGWTALPVFDSYVAPISAKDELRSLMIEEYRTIVGKEPIIK